MTPMYRTLSPLHSEISIVRTRSWGRLLWKCLLETTGHCTHECLVAVVITIRLTQIKLVRNLTWLQEGLRKPSPTWRAWAVESCCANSVFLREESPLGCPCSGGRSYPLDIKTALLWPHGLCKGVWSWEGNWKRGNWGGVAESGRLILSKPKQNTEYMCEILKDNLKWKNIKLKFIWQDTLL